jgi:hypothetical protein
MCNGISRIWIHLFTYNDLAKKDSIDNEADSRKAWKLKTNLELQFKTYTAAFNNKSEDKDMSIQPSQPQPSIQNHLCL